ncbi:unnamed protein product [Arctia plantaginis]|uniref:Uncharacterized protein n=1 Tax=Arctia plantaginis TaxID=874455 RepID=A0A8S0ZV53_ARCPL|nr:unnamed protein product [Arctia plantaginis]CAB3238678.1 unnamed protein product [Arctia plantaginis]
MAPLSSSLGVAKFASNAIRHRLTMFHQLTEVYRPSITKRKEELIEMIKEKAEMARQSELAKKMKVFKGFYTLEMSPPSINEGKRIAHDIKLFKEFMKTGAVTHLTVKQAWLLFLVGLEVYLWFFIGETIAKGRIVGYVVP